VDPLPWRQAWHTALYAAGLGFYVTRGGPAAHFTTATHGVTGAVLAEGFLRLWSSTYGDRPPSVVVDVGAGRGELATHLLHALHHIDSGQNAPRVIAVDVVDRPEGLDARIEWVRSPGGDQLPPELAVASLDDALVLAHEWLDVVPCDIAEVDGEGRLRLVLVDPQSGAESLGPELAPADAAWCQANWPPQFPGERVEIGASRESAWLNLVGTLRSGLAVAVDYGHVAPARPRTGTLTGYRTGSLTEPLPDGSCDLTAHVAMDTLAADTLATQRDQLRDLGLRGETPEHGLAARDPMAYLRGLERAGAEAELIRRGGFGDFWWAVKRVDTRHVT
jgi:SAM-dependent MidA family methyltransferase